MYTNGNGVSRDYAEVVKWYRLAAKSAMQLVRDNNQERPKQKIRLVYLKRISPIDTRNKKSCACLLVQATSKNKSA
jgi:hypothetical protein